MIEPCNLAAETREVLKELEDLTGIVVKQWRWPALKAEFDRLEISKKLLADCPSARSRLIDIVSIAESYFFRHPGHFDLLKAFAHDLAGRGLPCRVLCAGSSTGEEVWSAAAVLTARPAPPGQQHRVEGWELSRDRIDHAQKGHYNFWSCRKGFYGYDEFLEKTANGYRVGDALRRIVTFTEVNLKSSILPSNRMFDVVFFRNVSIYFSEETTRIVCRNLDSVIAEGGSLFAGPSDPIFLPEDNWQHRINERVRQFIRSTTHLPPKTPRPSNKPGRSQPRRSGDRARNVPITSCKDHVVTSQASPGEPLSLAEPNQPTLIDRVQAFADTGMYRQALDLLQGAPAEPTFLTRLWDGILRLNTGEFGLAVKSFRQCVFLRPDDPDIRRWLAVAYGSVGKLREAKREYRNAKELRS